MIWIIVILIILYFVFNSSTNGTPLSYSGGGTLRPNQNITVNPQTSQVSRRNRISIQTTRGDNILFTQPKRINTATSVNNEVNRSAIQIPLPVVNTTARTVTINNNRRVNNIEVPPVSALPFPIPSRGVKLSI